VQSRNEHSCLASWLREGELGSQMVQAEGQQVPRGGDHALQGLQEGAR